MKVPDFAEHRTPDDDNDSIGDGQSVSLRRRSSRRRALNVSLERSGRFQGAKLRADIFTGQWIRRAKNIMMWESWSGSGMPPYGCFM